MLKETDQNQNMIWNRGFNIIASSKKGMNPITKIANRCFDTISLALNNTAGRSLTDLKKKDHAAEVFHSMACDVHHQATAPNPLMCRAKAQG
jgi:hypothetical protein